MPQIPTEEVEEVEEANNKRLCCPGTIPGKRKSFLMRRLWLPKEETVIKIVTEEEVIVVKIVTEEEIMVTMKARTKKGTNQADLVVLLW